MQGGELLGVLTATDWREPMGRIDGWTDEHVDYAIYLLVRAERELGPVSPELCAAINRFLKEKA
jgi:hypothetical protein